MSDLDPTALRAWAVAHRTCAKSAHHESEAEGHRIDAAVADLLADLLDAIGDPDDLRLWVHDINSIMLRGVARRIAAVLEAHRD